MKVLVTILPAKALAIFLNKKNCGTPNESLEYTLTSLGENLVSTEKSNGSLIMKF